MYVRTGEALGQVRMLYGQFSGPLGQEDIQQRIAKAIDARRQGKTLSSLIIRTIVHPVPKESELVDFVLMNNLLGHENQVLTELRKIHSDLYKRDPSHRRQIDAEWKLRHEVFRATTALDRQKIKTFLVKALAAPLVETAAGGQRMSGNWPSVAQSFAKAMLPPALTRRISRSKAAAAQLANLAVTLQSIADDYWKSGKDAGLSRAVEAERKRILDEKRMQEEKNTKRKMTLKDI